MTIKSTLRFIFSRILQALPLMLGVILINFIIIHAAPGDPVSMMVGPNPVSEEYIERVRHDLGIDQPIHIQLISYLNNILRGDLGISYAYRQPALNVVLSRVPPTILLMGCSYILAAFFGILMGVIASWRTGSTIDNLATVLALIGYSVPAFWTAFLAILFFSIELGWFPIGGMMNVRLELSGLPLLIDILKHMVLPTLVLTIFFMALITRLTRASMLEVLHSDYITLARSKGLSESRVIFKHALPNALLPVVTVIGMQFGYLLAGAVLTETVFAWPGLGRLMVEAVSRRDFPVLMAIFIISSMLIIIMNIITDLIYTLINPKIRINA